MVRTEVEYIGIFHGKSAAQNLKSSETWLNLFKIVKKNAETNF